MSKEAYRDRIAPGMIVYYVGEQSGYYGKPNDKIVTKKGTVTEDLPTDRKYPFVRIWKDINVEPKFGLELSMSPRAMFTAQEVARLIADNPDVIEASGKSIDGMIIDDETNQALTALLGGEALVRLAEDGLRRPHDPEYS